MLFNGPRVYTREPESRVHRNLFQKAKRSYTGQVRSSSVSASAHRVETSLRQITNDLAGQFPRIRPHPPQHMLLGFLFIYKNRRSYIKEETSKVIARSFKDPDYQDIKSELLAL